MTSPNCKIQQVIYAIIVLTLPGCNGCRQWTDGLFGPAPGEENRKAIMESGTHGAESIEKLVEAYRRAHLREDMREIRTMLGWNIGYVKPDGTYPWYTRQSVQEDVMEKIFRIPVKEIVYEKGEPPDPEKWGEAMYYNTKTGRAYIIVGKVYGKIILVTQDGRRLDPSYVILEHHGGRFVLNSSPEIAQDALGCYQQSRPQIWQGQAILSLKKEENSANFRHEKLRGRK